MKSLRITVLLIVTVLSIPALLSPLALLAALGNCSDHPSVHHLMRCTPTTLYGLFERVLFLAAFFASLYAWLAFFRMGVAWVSGERTRRWWPLSGTFAALVALLPLMLISLQSATLAPDGLDYLKFVSQIYGPSILLACYLVAFHLRHASPAAATGAAQSRQ